MANRFITIQKAVVPQKIGGNCSRMKWISSYLHAFFLFNKGKKNMINNCRSKAALYDNL